MKLAGIFIATGNPLKSVGMNVAQQSLLPHGPTSRFEITRTVVTFRIIPFQFQ
ncbi:hypothetical protein SAMN05443245_1588 [Paraburkholderia fungorum]|uniref:Uncharacterized protein n=1 Tax=Paraburkholderia fungorum TaxID=134537 RepID=A0A1H1BBN3_9BURK|nr:hypothetical protein SAMN05443245_1588 [Paraburkholderia fungorum]